MSSRRLVCSCCGLWRISTVTLEHGGQRLRITHRGYWQADCRDVAEVERVLARYGGPALGDFEAAE